MSTESEHIRNLKATTKDYNNVCAGVERGQSAAAYTLAEARNIATACEFIETFIGDTITGKLTFPNTSEASSRWDMLCLALEKACRKGAFGLNEAAAIHSSTVRMTAALKSALVYYDKKAEEAKKVRFVTAPEDNIETPAVTGN